MSEQDAEAKEEGQEAGSDTELDSLADLSELEKIKLELQKEKEIYYKCADQFQTTSYKYIAGALGGCAAMTRSARSVKMRSS